MADDVAITAGSGTTVKTDEVAVNGGASGHVQFVKLVDGRANGTDGTPGDVQGLWVVARRDLLCVEVASGGLTTASTAYTAGDQVGTQFTVANAARTSGGTGTITGVSLIDAADIIGAYDVVFFNASVSLASDNAAAAVSDADALKCIGIVPLAAYDIGNNRIAQSFNLALTYTCVGSTSLFAGLITRSGHTFFAATTDLQLRVCCERN